MYHPRDNSDGGDGDAPPSKRRVPPLTPPETLRQLHDSLDALWPNCTAELNYRAGITARITLYETTECNFGCYRPPAWDQLVADMRKMGDQDLVDVIRSYVDKRAFKPLYVDDEPRYSYHSLMSANAAFVETRVRADLTLSAFLKSPRAVPAEVAQVIFGPASYGASNNTHKKVMADFVIRTVMAPPKGRGYSTYFTPPKNLRLFMYNRLQAHRIIEIPFAPGEANMNVRYARLGIEQAKKVLAKAEADLVDAARRDQEELARTTAEHEARVASARATLASEVPTLSFKFE